MQKSRADYKIQELFTKDFKTTEMCNYSASHYYDLCEGINFYWLAWTFWASWETVLPAELRCTWSWYNTQVQAFIFSDFFSYLLINSLSSIQSRSIIYKSISMIQYTKDIWLVINFK